MLFSPDVAAPARVDAAAFFILPMLIFILSLFSLMSRALFICRLFRSALAMLLCHACCLGARYACREASAPLPPVRVLLMLRQMFSSVRLSRSSASGAPLLPTSARYAYQPQPLFYAIRSYSALFMRREMLYWAPAAIFLIFVAARVNARRPPPAYPPWRDISMLRGWGADEAR